MTELSSRLVVRLKQGKGKHNHILHACCTHIRPKRIWRQTWLSGCHMIILMTSFCALSAGRSSLCFGHAWSGPWIVCSSVPMLASYIRDIMWRWHVLPEKRAERAFVGWSLSVDFFTRSKNRDRACSTRTLLLGSLKLRTNSICIDRVCFMRNAISEIRLNAISISLLTQSINAPLKIFVVESPIILVPVQKLQIMDCVRSVAIIISSGTGFHCLVRPEILQLV